MNLCYPKDEMLHELEVAARNEVPSIEVDDNIAATRQKIDDEPVMNEERDVELDVVARNDVIVILSTT